MAKKKKPAPQTPPHPTEPEGGPLERQKAFVDERLRSLEPKCDGDSETVTERGTHRDNKEADET